MDRALIVREIERQVRSLCARRIEPTRAELGEQEYRVLLGEEQGTVDRLHFPGVWPDAVRLSSPPVFRSTQDRGVDVLVVRVDRPTGIRVTS